MLDPRTPAEIPVEYHIEFMPMPIDIDALLARMNELGAERWRLVQTSIESLIYQNSVNGVRLWFMRELQ